MCKVAEARRGSLPFEKAYAPKRERERERELWQGEERRYKLGQNYKVFYTRTEVTRFGAFSELTLHIPFPFFLFSFFFFSFLVTVEFRWSR